jgi:hypothetical protein
MNRSSSRGGSKGPQKRPTEGAAVGLSTPARPMSRAPVGNSAEPEDPLGHERHTGPPRSLNVWDFATARASEIKCLHESLQSSGGKGLFTLPRHLRRRTTSHSRRQFLFRPKKQKVGTESAEAEHDETEGKPQSRKVRRRALLQAIRRGEGNVVR